MDDSDGVSSTGVPDITQFLSVCMAEDDIVKVEEPILSDSYEETQDGTQYGCEETQFTSGGVDVIENPLTLNAEGAATGISGNIYAQKTSGRGGIVNLSSKECPVCGKTVSRSKMKVHMRTHTGEKPYQCDICHKCFARSDKLITHKRIHTGEKPHTCFCGKQFRRVDHLKDHFKTHDVDGTKRDAILEKAKSLEYSSRGPNARLPTPVSLTCSYCGMTFTQSYKYKRHLRVHTGEKPYVCFCGNSYTRSEGLRRHQLNFHGHEKDDYVYNEVPIRIVPEVILEVKQPLPGDFEMSDTGILESRYFQTAANDQEGAEQNLADGAEEMNHEVVMENAEEGEELNEEEYGQQGEDEDGDVEVSDLSFSELQSSQEEEGVGHSFTELDPSQMELYLMSNKDCPVCGKNVSRSKMKVHLRTHTGEKPFQCDICHKSFARSDKLTCHKRIHTGEKPYICFCGKRFSRIDHMKMHAAIHKVDGQCLDAMLEEARNKDLINRGLPIPIQTPATHTCSYCGQTFTQNYKYKRHLRVHTGEKPYECFCGCRYSRSERLRRHQIKFHGLSEKDESHNDVPMRIMPEVILEVKQPVSGSLEVNESGILESQDCKTATEVGSDDVVVKENPLAAMSKINKPIPTPSFGTLSDIEHVMREVVVEQVTQPKQKLTKTNGMYCCEFCPKTFKKAHKLGLHRRTHTGEKPHLCASCGKAFARRDHMLKHMNIHLKRRRDSIMNTLNVWVEEQSSIVNDDVKVEEEEPLDGGEFSEEKKDERTDGESPDTETEGKEEESDELHICRICGHAFRKVYNLQSHMQIHTERSLFECGVCSKQFKVKKNYEAHLLNHETEMDLSKDIIETTDLNRARSQRAQCPICAKWVVSMSSLETHMRSHTGERPFQCNTCDHTFIRKADMLRHMKSHTGERPYHCQYCSTTFSRKDKLVFHMKRHEDIIN